MTDLTRPPVLVTGSNRAGTTWVGRMLCHGGELNYIHEPFNSTNRPRPLELRLGGHYTHVPSCPDPAAFAAAMGRTVSARTRYHRQLIEDRDPKATARVVRAAAVQARQRINRRRALVKDPIAVLSVPWLAETFAMAPVVMVRHPGAYVSSSRRLRWRYDFAYLASQHRLMDTAWAGGLADAVRRAARQVPDEFDQAILMWRLVYTVVDGYRRDFPTWRFVTYEHLAEDPLTGFAELYDHLGLTFHDDARQRIAADTGPENVADRPVTEAHNTRRNSRQAARTWLGRLDPSEVASVRREVGELADRFYEPDTWPSGA